MGGSGILKTAQEVQALVTKMSLDVGDQELLQRKGRFAAWMKAHQSILANWGDNLAWNFVGVSSAASGSQLSFKKINSPAISCSGIMHVVCVLPQTGCEIGGSVVHI